MTRDALFASPPDLSAYAAARGLEYRGDMLQLGFCTIPANRHFNQMRGVLPGGARGQVGQERHWEIGAPSVQGSVAAYSTYVLVLVPEAVAPLIRLSVRPAKPRLDSRFLQTLDVSGSPLASRHVQAAPDAEPELLRRILEGELAAWVASMLPADGEIVFRHGTLIVSIPRWVGDEATLDSLCRVASALEPWLRPATPPAPVPFSTPLPPPDWPDRPGGIKLFGRRVAVVPTEDQSFGSTLDQPPNPKLLELARDAEAKRGLALEDPLALHRAFPRATMPGEAAVVWRSGDCRLILMIECGYFHGIGCNVVQFGLTGAAPDTPEPYGLPVKLPSGDVRRLVRDGVLSFHRARRPKHLSVPDLLELQAQARDLALREGFPLAA